MSQFITSIAALISASAWPLVFVVVLLAYRKPVSDAVRKLPTILDRLQILKIGALEAELDKVAAVSASSSTKGEVTSEQVSAAAKIESHSTELGTQELLKQLDRLCLEYDTIRSAMPSGYERTSAMTNVLIRMRALAPSTSGMIAAYKGSGSPGSRLAAIAMMQMEPKLGDLEWLKERFNSEHPFVFYHAALALRNMTFDSDAAQRNEISSIAKSARTIVENFKHGIPDPDTIEALSSIEEC